MTERRVVHLLARYRVGSLDEFVERHVADLASSGMFVRTENPLAVGTFVEIDCRSEGDERLLAALGRVVRVREHGDAREGLPPGMALQFLRVDKAAERALEMGERSSRFGLRVDADDRTWSSQQRPSLGLSTPPPPPPSVAVQSARIEVCVDGSMAPPAAEAERTPPLFAALFGGESAALKPGRVPAGFEGLSSHGSAPDSSEVAAMTPRSAIARPFLAPRDDVPTPRMPVVADAARIAPPPGGAVRTFAATTRLDSVVPPPGAAADAARGAPFSREPVSAEPVTTQETFVPGADSIPAPDHAPTSTTVPLARSAVDVELAAARVSEAPATEPPAGLARAVVRPVPPPNSSIAWGPWVAVLVFLLGAAWLAQWLGDAPAAEESTGDVTPR